MYVRQALDLLEGLIPESEDNKDISPNHLKLLIVFSIMWSLGALLELGDRQKVCLSSIRNQPFLWDYVTNVSTSQFIM